MNNSSNNHKRKDFKVASLSLALLLGCSTIANAAVEKLTVSGNQILVGGENTSLQDLAYFGVTPVGALKNFIQHKQ